MGKTPHTEDVMTSSIRRLGTFTSPQRKKQKKSTKKNKNFRFQKGSFNGVI